MQNGALTLLVAALVALGLWFMLPGDNPALDRLVDLPVETRAPDGLIVTILERHSVFTVVDRSIEDRRSTFAVDLDAQLQNVGARRTGELTVELRLTDADGAPLVTHPWGRPVALEPGQLTQVRFVNSTLDAEHILQARSLQLVVE